MEAYDPAGIYSFCYISFASFNYALRHAADAERSSGAATVSKIILRLNIAKSYEHLGLTLPG